MNTEKKLPDLNDAFSIFAAAPDVSAEEIQKIAAANSELDSNPEFLANLQKAYVASALRRALEKRHETLSSFASRWNKTRQYVSRIFGADHQTNFTIETITQAAFLLGLRVTVQVHRPDQRVIVRSRISGNSAYRELSPTRIVALTNQIKPVPHAEHTNYPDTLAA